MKILGGMKANVKTFIYPKDNHHDFIKFKEKYDKNDFLKDIEFVEAEHITDVLKIVFAE